MNKHILFSLLAAAALTACSSDDATTGIDTQVAALTFEDSDVEIRLSSGSGASLTRSSIESNAYGAFETNGIGVFMLGWQTMNVNPTEVGLTWTPGAIATTGTPNFAIKLDNLEANAVMSDDATQTNIEWATPATYYYPLGQWYNYRFYGYAPRVEGNNLISTSTQRQAVITIDGTNDVIWGRDDVTTAEDHAAGYTVPQYAYSSRFFRESAANAESLPNIPFKHLLARLTFSVIAGADAYGSTEEAVKMRIRSIKLLDIPTVGTLTIADRTNPANEGNIVFNWNENLADLPLLGANDYDFSNDDPSALPAVSLEETQVGQGILIPVPEAGHRFFIRVKMTDENGTEFDEVEYPFELEKLNPSYQLEANHSYNIRLVVRGPRKIEVRATLKNWEPVENVFDDREIN